MLDEQELIRRACAGIGRALIFLLVAIAAVRACDAQSQKPFPVVSRADVPFYPRVAQAAHIDGVVRLRIVTDGDKVSSIDIKSGPPMLARAAEENVETWRFERHSPADFEATFRYVLLPSQCDSKCNCGDTQHSTARLRLPESVEVDAKTVMICDPVVSNRRANP